MGSKKIFVNYIWKILFTLDVVFVDLAEMDYKTVFLQDSCPCTAIDHLRCEPASLKPFRSGAGIVALSPQAEFHKEFYCILTIRSPRNTGIILRINHLDIPVSSRGCKAGMLKVHRKGKTPDVDDVLGLCGSRIPEHSVFVSNSNQVNISYHQGRSIINKNKSFNLTFTYFWLSSQEKGCKKNRFQCLDRRCVSPSLECDGLKNCEDGSDESMAYRVCGKYANTSDPRVGIGVGVAMALLFIIGLSVAALFKRRRSKRNSSAGQERGTRISVHINIPRSSFSSDDIDVSHETGVASTTPEDQPPSYESLFPES
ncbi:hypothetical protein CAPTEDRAFT_219222 [Capitella teleta]|uniref:CUB domain-containing protein n=1 Tax=Capitella teleta TaxID=283909 RepID=R7T934_CAPTE|nr:hypothetical protein CAPTEDRAFT_219222 [Capitella teleta]|eukprot:ELT89943.1 hypothetical protein CAPTEDRAFT_219222 [Capitella teleta]